MTERETNQCTILMAIVPLTKDVTMSNALAIARIQNISNRALYIAMCKGKVAQSSIHPGKKRPVIGQGYAYHGHIDIEKV